MEACSWQQSMGKSTAQIVFSEFENALAARRDDFIRFPTAHIEIQTTINNFEMKYGIPQIVGVVDGSQITCARRKYGRLL